MEINHNCLNSTKKILHVITISSFCKRRDRFKDTELNAKARFSLSFDKIRQDKGLRGKHIKLFKKLYAYTNVFCFWKLTISA